MTQNTEHSFITIVYLYAKDFVYFAHIFGACTQFSFIILNLNSVLTAKFH